ncbi:protein Lilipod isoform X2 [Bacillus rossius redtenbacheri]|uniref:protein Lilipod isoform X2 n=1 Tax=Bacillus rossius redtenbacheri TaxID=93214 RepID=UPI002FDD095D
MDETADIREQLFHNSVREYVIFLLFGLLLIILSSALIGRLRRRDKDDYDEDDAAVCKISVWLCTFSLAVSFGQVLLLPISIVSNEVLLNYPDSYYVKWLNSSLIQGFWNHMFLLSNLSLFVLLPFAFLFQESVGFSGFRRSLIARVIETSIVFTLMSFLVLGMTYILSSFLDEDRSSIQTLLSVWSYYLPFQYSCVSFLGVLMLVLCTPLGFVHLFTVVGDFLVKPQFLRDVDEEFAVARLEEDCLRRRLHLASETRGTYLLPPPMSPPAAAFAEGASLLGLQNGELQSGLAEALRRAEAHCRHLDQLRHTSSLQRNLVYPVAMVLLILLTFLTVMMVLQNIIVIVLGYGNKDLPFNTTQFKLGDSSLSMLGVFGSTLEIVLIFYLQVTSFVGLYTSRVFSRVRPRPRGTSLTHVIVNSALALVLSSALPLLSRILGITNFDLLGDFGQIEWLGNFKIIFLYNVLFAVFATVILLRGITAVILRELYARFWNCLRLLLGQWNVIQRLSPLQLHYIMYHDE